MIAEGLDVFLADFGVVCTSGGQTFKGLLDTPDETLNMGGVNILSTPQGILPDRQARERKVGGEILCAVW